MEADSAEHLKRRVRRVRYKIGADRERPDAETPFDHPVGIPPEQFLAIARQRRAGTVARKASGQSARPAKRRIERDQGVAGPGI